MLAENGYSSRPASSGSGNERYEYHIFLRLSLVVAMPSIEYSMLGKKEI